jgi:protein tyrosine phosphatase
MLRNSFDEIIPGLWLGDINSSHNIKFLKDNNITIVINCTKDIPYVNVPGVSFYRIPVDDSLKHEDILLMEKSLPDVLEFLIYTHKQNSRNILIHCFAGVQRSAIVTLSYLFLLKMAENYKNGIREDKEKVANDILKYIIQKRPQAFFGGHHINFKPSFERYFDLKLK